MNKSILLLVVVISINLVYGIAPTLDPIPTPQNLTQGEAFYYDVNATDPEGGPLYFSDDTDNFDIDPTTGEISFTPDITMVGSFVAVIIVRDNESLIDAQAINFTVNGLPVVDSIDDQVVLVGETFYYDVNATDNEDGSNLNFYDNSPLFDINLTTGVINYSAIYADLGVHSITITAVDSQGANSTESFNLVVNDVPTINLIPNQSAQEDSLFELNVSQYVNNSVGSLSFYDNTSLFDTGVNNGIISFTPDYPDVGFYGINITVNDSYGASNSTIFYINISEVNDAPTFPSISNQTAYVGETFYLFVNATDEENDSVYYYDNASFFDINETTGIINLSVNSSMIGNYSINITVNDSNGAEYSDIFYLFILQNRAPVFPRNVTKRITPDFDNYVDLAFPNNEYTGSEFLYVSSLDNSFKNSFLNFSLDIIPNISTIVNASLNLTGNYSSGSLNLSVYLVNSSWGSNYSYNNQPNVSSQLDNIYYSSGTASFYVYDAVNGWFNGSLGNYGLLIKAENRNLTNETIKFYSSDSTNSSNWPSLYVAYNSLIANQTLTVSDSLDNVFDLDDYFYDPEGNNLSYSVSSTNYVTISIDSENRVSISAGASAGVDEVTFYASDGYSNTSSNLVRISVIAGGGTDSGSSSSSSSGGGSSKKKIASLNIILDSERETIESGDIFQLPVKIENSGQVDIRSISLSASSDPIGIDVKLSNSLISGLSVGETSSLMLTMDTSNAQGGSYVITLEAESDSPSLTESAIFVLDVADEKESIEKQMDVAIDMFANNPECMELQELIDRAKDQLSQSQYDEARSNIELAIEGCKNLIRVKNEPLLMSSGKYSSLGKTLILVSFLSLLIIVGYFIFVRSKFIKSK